MLLILKILEKKFNIYFFLGIFYFIMIWVATIKFFQNRFDPKPKILRID